ncbi:hypothetical protein [Polluticoccus soli]|uniref:hypothetical protein n=1 Tax=Polluticoccus soli TaxID=3034150 RepID=UPI0023E17BDB|nr:hypothetical protein [Flavipsychrobacter sp. JY13-12]
MKKKTAIIKNAFFSLFVAACTNAQDKNVTQLASVPDSQSAQKDTTITYDIEGVSTEGARAEVKYVNGEISESTTTIYGEMGKATVVYKFEKDRIKVSETQYAYPTHVVDLKPDDKIKASKQSIYYIDLDGNVIGEPVPDRVDIFKEFKETVAFKLE